MAVRIRLTRKGGKKKPIYRLVAADSKAPRDGKFLEILGHYNPNKDPAEIKLDEEGIKRWLNNGAIASEAVKAIFKKHGLYKGPAATN